MTKAELIADLATECRIAKTDAALMLAALEVVTTSALNNGETVTIPGIVKLTPKAREARTGRNPRTGEAVEIAAKTVVTAKISAALAKAVA
ncbi:MAG: HU family DNA-binding protein [Paracoccus sp. (in: a-proteobacteria)]|nr:HU family DNA-binding protein [Paracoccus sp. (in: a-proteobacteria)]